MSKLLSIDEALEHLGGLGRTTLFGLIKSGEIATVKIGKRRLVTVDELDAYIERCTEKAAKPPARIRTCRQCGHVHQCPPPARPY